MDNLFGELARRLSPLATLRSVHRTVGRRVLPIVSWRIMLVSQLLKLSTRYPDALCKQVVDRA